MVYRLLTSLLLLTALCNAVYGCMCFKGHHQEQYCKANYVIRGMVEEVQVPPTVIPGISNKPIIHKVKVTRVFKDDTQTIREGATVYLKSGRSSLQCGIQLAEGDMLLGGQGDENGLRIGLCDINTEWNRVPDCQRKSLVYNLYNCRCQIQKCGEKEICRRSSTSCKMAFPLESVEDAYCESTMWGCEWRTCPSPQNIFYNYIRQWFNTV